MARLLGPDGLPVRRQDLTRPQAEPALGGVRSVWTAPVASGLTPDRLAAILRAADNGHLTDFLVLADEIEERELHYRSVLSTRKLALTELEPVIEAASEERRDVEIADAARRLVAQPEFAAALEGLADALGKGFSAVEIFWGTAGGSWTPVDYVWREPWFFDFDRVTGRSLRLRTPADPDGEPLRPWSFLVHMPGLKAGRPWRAGLARLAVWGYMLKGFALKDWMAFLEVYGMPFRLGTYQAGATEAEKRALLRAVRDIAADAAAIIPEGMDIRFIEASANRGSEAYEKKCRYIDEQLSKIVLGQTTTTDAISGGHAVSREHNEVRRDIQRSDARKLAATVNRHLIEPFCSFNFGPQAAYPRLRFPLEEPEDLSAMMDRTERFVRLGGKVGMAHIRDRLGIEDPGEAEELLAAPAHETTLAGATARARPAAAPLTARADHEDEDEIDRLIAEEMADWEEIAAPLTGPLTQAVREASSWEELVTRLEASAPDGTELARRLARATSLARGLGNTDGQGDGGQGNG